MLGDSTFCLSVIWPNWPKYLQVKRSSVHFDSRRYLRAQESHMNLFLLPYVSPTLPLKTLQYWSARRWPFIVLSEEIFERFLFFSSCSSSSFFFFLLQTSSYLQAAFENARKRSWRCIVPEFKRQKIPRMFVLKKEQKSRASVVPRVPPPLPSPLPAEAVCHGVGMDFKETTSGSINSLLCCVV